MYKTRYGKHLSKRMKYYGCYLKDFKWYCKKFSTMKEADEYALLHKDESYATALRSMSDFIPTCFEKVVLEDKLKIPLSVNK